MWRDTRFAAALATLTLAAGSAARAADEASIVLAEGEGAAQVRSACVICHSLDYIVMNSPFQDAAGWEKTVAKMTMVMGAPISADDSAIIVAYLARNYGKGDVR